jgi:ECF sigma factor
MIVLPRHFLGWLVSTFPFPGGPRPREPGSPSTIAGCACATTSPSINCSAPAVLGCAENVLVWVEEAARLGYSPNRRELASGTRVMGTGDRSLATRSSHRRSWTGCCTTRRPSTSAAKATGQKGDHRLWPANSTFRYKRDLLGLEGSLEAGMEICGRDGPESSWRNIDCSSRQIGIEYRSLTGKNAGGAGLNGYSPTRVTALLSQLTQGDREAADKLIPLVYDELKRPAATCAGSVATIPYKQPHLCMRHF